jgi:hypothetical protein
LNKGISNIFKYIYIDEKLTNYYEIFVENEENNEYYIISNTYILSDFKVVFTKLDNYLVGTNRNKELKSNKIFNDKLLESLITSQNLNTENLTMNLIVSKISPLEPVYYYKTFDFANILNLQPNQKYYIDKNNLQIDFINPNNKTILLKNVIDNDITELNNNYYNTQLYVENNVTTKLLDSNILFNDVKQLKIKLISNSYIDDLCIFNYLKPWREWSGINSILKIDSMKDVFYQIDIFWNGTINNELSLSDPVVIDEYIYDNNILYKGIEGSPNKWVECDSKIIKDDISNTNNTSVSYITFSEYKKLNYFINSIVRSPIAKQNYIIMRNQLEPYILNNLTNWLYNPSFFLDVISNINKFLEYGQFNAYFDGTNILFKNDLHPQYYYIDGINEIASYITNEYTFVKDENKVFKSIDSFNKINIQINNWINKIIDSDINNRYFGVSIHKLCRYLVEIGNQFNKLISDFTKPFTDTPEYYYNNPLKFVINKIWENHYNDSNINKLNKEFSDKMELKYKINNMNNILSSINYYNDISYDLTGIYSNNIFNNFTYLKEFIISNLSEYDPNIFVNLKPSYKLLTNEIYPYTIDFKGGEILPNRTYSIDFLNGEKITEDIIINDSIIYPDQLSFNSSYNIKSTDFIVVKQNNEFTIKETTILGYSYLIKFNDNIEITQIDQIYYRKYNLQIIFVDKINKTINILVPYTEDEKKLINEININDSFELRNSIGIKDINIDNNNKQYLDFYSNKFNFIVNKTILKTDSNIYILQKEDNRYYVEGVNIKKNEYNVDIITMVNLFEIKNMKEVVFNYVTDPPIEDTKNGPLNDNIMVPFEYEIYNTTSNISIKPIKISTFGDGKIILYFTNDNYEDIIFHKLNNWNKIKQVKKLDQEITNQINNIELYDEYLYRFEMYIESTSDTKIFLYNNDSTNLNDYDGIDVDNGILEPTKNINDKTSIYYKQNIDSKQTVFTVIKNYDINYTKNIYFIQKNTWIIPNYSIDSINNTITLEISNDFIFKYNGEYYYKFGLPGQEKLIDKSTITPEIYENNLQITIDWNFPITGTANFIQYYVETKNPINKPINNKKAKITFNYPYQYNNNVLFYILPYSGTGKEFGNYLYKITTNDLSFNNLIGYERGVCDEVIYLFKSGSQINGKLFDRFFDNDGYINLIFSVDELLDLSDPIKYTYRLSDFVDKKINKLEYYQSSFNFADYVEQTQSNQITLMVKDNVKPYVYTSNLIQKPNKFYLVSYIPYKLTNIFNDNKFIKNDEMKKQNEFTVNEIISYEKPIWKPVYKMFEYIRLYFNDQLMEELNEDVFLINYFLYYNEERKRKSNAITKLRLVNEEKWQCYIPLIFWFACKPGLSIPIIALPYTQIRLVYKLNDIKNILTNDLTNSKFRYKNEGIEILKDNPEMTIHLNTDFILLDTLERKLFGTLSHEYMIERYVKIPINFINNPNSDAKTLKLSGLIKDIHFIAKPVNFSDISYYPEVITKYDQRYSDYLKALNYYNIWIDNKKVFKTVEERKYNFEIDWINYITENLDVYLNLTPDQLNNNNLMDTYPYYDIKRLINQFSKWSIYDYELLRYLYFYQVFHIFDTWYEYYLGDLEKGGKLDNILSMYLKYLFSNKKIVNEISPIESMVIKVDGTNLFAERDYRYFSDVIPYNKFKNSLPTGFYSYTFSLYPLEDQNSGHLNFSHFSNVELIVKSNVEAFEKYGSYNLNTCIKEYNILRIMSGLASTAWID